MLLINPLIFAEVSVGYTSIDEVIAALPADTLNRADLPYAAAFQAGKAFAEYRRRGGSRLSPLPDFYIGAHALVAGYDLLTRDTRRYRTYFPGLNLITPDA
jgi:predicted nucleic acid-binding protein